MYCGFTLFDVKNSFLSFSGVLLFNKIRINESSILSRIRCGFLFISPVGNCWIYWFWGLASVNSSGRFQSSLEMFFHILLFSSPRTRWSTHVFHFIILISSSLLRALLSLSLHCVLDNSPPSGGCALSVTVLIWLCSDIMCFECYVWWKGRTQSGRDYLQILYLIKDLFPEYTKTLKLNNKKTIVLR